MKFFYYNISIYRTKKLSPKNRKHPNSQEKTNEWSKLKLQPFYENFNYYQELIL